MVKAVFLDRDGTINKHIIGRPNPKHVAPWYYAEFEYIDGVPEAVAAIKRLGFTTHLVTNQPDVDDGYMTEETLDAIHLMLKNQLKLDTIQAARTRNTPEYKPNPGMLEKVIKDFNVSRNRSYMVGDTWRDIVAGHRAGVTTIYLGNGYNCPEEYKDIKPHHTVADLTEAAKIIALGETWYD
jgi:histidinol-phosphate phosphatase family protein